ncbi:hypothetical protein C8J57DRAFT_1240031 [Mycena rebaudengoi]|nr:hypothetical protein C8J57DRAFT_1240031 [Mycena rebaudengoi]
MFPCALVALTLIAIACARPVANSQGAPTTNVIREVDVNNGKPWYWDLERKRAPKVHIIPIFIDFNGHPENRGMSADEDPVKRVKCSDRKCDGLQEIGGCITAIAAHIDELSSPTSQPRNHCDGGKYTQWLGAGFSKQACPWMSVVRIIAHDLIRCACDVADVGGVGNMVGLEYG